MGQRPNEIRSRPRLRRATVADATEIARVQVLGWQAAYRGLVSAGVLDGLDIEEQAATWAEILSVGDVPVFVVEDESTVVAFVQLAASGDDDIAEIVAMYVLPGHWRHGHGRRKCEKAIAESRAGDFTAVALWVLSGNAPARRFYEAMGFQTDDVTSCVDDRPGEVTRIRYVIRA